ncbi:MAG: primosomal protein N' [Armatimonadetes bacterium]|nr:primosomal protein N' [Armatimonadota bacterium]PIU63971.1 MAG: primosomal protein N' [Armatimonadetes bacterium CG07_land_8_20_14_0_80_59_28]PIX43917.1 MAG: primosomal protein N' [Armatimonadetes bacterium CG_4_8_14_3_um_filter_58_9]
MTRCTPALTSSGEFATVVIDSSSAVVDKPLTYRVPAHLDARVGVGSYVLVPLRNALVPAYVVGRSQQCPVDSAKLIAQMLHDVPMFDQRQLKLADWVTQYYHCSQADSLRCVAPTMARQKFARVYRLTDGQSADGERRPTCSRRTTRDQIVELLTNIEQPLTAAQIQEQISNSNASRVLESLIRDGIVFSETVALDKGTRPRTVKGVRLGTGNQELDAGESAILAAVNLSGGEMPLALLKERRLYNAAAKRLLGSGTLILCEIESPRVPRHVDLSGSQVRSLTDEQRDALKEICDALTFVASPQGQESGFASEASVFVLHGVTASGKTEVYLRAIVHCLHLGRQALVLVPEISLTEQTLAIFRSAFGSEVAVFHSALSKGERFDEWNRVREGKARIVLGARSAVFAPLTNIGLIVIDEEHDTSYKQENSPRYHAREVALRRAQIENAVIVLGSATPSMESYHCAERGKYRCISMLHRIGNRTLPAVEVVDLRQAVNRDSERSPSTGRRLTIISPRLCESIETALAAKQQVILFLNRRGFCPVIYCPRCGVSETCRRCSVSLTFHQRSRSLRCHHCNQTRPAPSTCSHCGAPIVSYMGMGTERVEAEVTSLFPEARVLRMDRDTTLCKGSHGRFLESFHKREADILVGTQMIAKGLDFPGVALVGVILADMSLYVPDFRASERTFQLLAQVSGRAGRGEFPGRVVVQTHQPEHYAIVAAATQDYLGFWKQELKIRRQLPYPPFTHLANIVAVDTDPAESQQRIHAVEEAVKSFVGKGAGTEVVGPAPCPLSKVKDHYRWHLLLRDRSRPRLHETLGGSIDLWPVARRRGIIVDVDPLSLM